MAGLSVLTVNAQPASRELHYLGEVGHLGTTFDIRKSVKYGQVEVVSQPDGAVRLQGRDDDRDHGVRLCRHWLAWAGRTFGKPTSTGMVARTS